jgi:signal transduction histidine kinase/ActR/RegA family two-component response regulator
MKKASDTNSDSAQFSYSHLQFKPEWQYENPLTGVTYRNAVIPQKLFFSSISGVIELESTKEAITILERLFKSGVLDNCIYIRIVDYSGIRKASFNSRLLYANTLNRLHDEHGCTPSVTYICGASVLLKSMLRLFSTYVRQKFIFVPTITDAFLKISSGKDIALPEKELPVTITAQEIDRFAAQCAKILFDDSFSELDPENETKMAEHPLHDLYAIISLLNKDLREMQKTDKEQKNRLQEALENTKSLYDKLLHEKKLVEEKEKIQQLLIDNIHKAKKDAESANKAKSLFLANVSHELRTPLHAVIGMTELLATTQLDTEQHEYVDIILTSSEQLLQLINDILDLSSIDAGNLKSKKTPFNIAEVIEEIVSRISMRAASKKLEILIEKDENINATIYGQTVYLRQILTSLLDNAVKFTSEGTVIVAIKKIAEDISWQKFRISVSDEGIGIPDDKKDLIFQRFTQLDPSTTRKAGGTGLGLTIAKELTELMGGSLNVRNREQRGAEFILEVTFPTRSDDAQELSGPSENKIMTQQAKTTRQIPAAEKTILLVEDNLVNRKVAEAMITKLGYRVNSVVNGLEAVETLRTKRYDLVMMDLQMPVMDGFEATKTIRNKNSGVLDNDITIIAMTANATAEDQNHCIAAGMNDYLSKPVTIDIIGRTLQKWLPGNP